MQVSERLVLLVFAVVVLGASAAVVVPIHRDYLADPAEKARRGEVNGLDELSMLREANAARGLEVVRERAPGDVLVQSLVLRPTVLSATVVEPERGIERRFAVDPGFGVHAEEGDAGADHGATFAALDMGVPERMAREVLADLGRPESDLDYVVASISSSGDPVRWLLYLQHGRVADRIWVADADGANVRRNGT